MKSDGLPEGLPKWQAVARAIWGATTGEPGRRRHLQPFTKASQLGAGRGGMSEPILDDQQLSELMEKDPHAYQRELLRPWAGMDSDMHDLVTLLAEEGEVRLIDDVEFSDDGEMVSITLPDWIIELQRHYVAKHGQKKGIAIYLKAMAIFSSHIMPDEPQEEPRVVSLEHLVSKRH